MVLAIAACIYMACNIGANDVANAMGTSVGSGSLTFKQAIYVAAVAEFAGAFLLADMYPIRFGRECLIPQFSRMHPFILYTE